MFPALLLSKWALRAYVVVGIIILLLGLRAHYIKKGKEQGKQEAISKVQEDANKEIELVRKEAVEKIEGANRVITEIQMRYAATVQVQQQLAAALQNLSLQQRAVQAQVTSTPDSQLRPLVIRTLNLRAPTDNVACYTPAEEREIANRVLDQPICRQQNNKLLEEVTIVKSQVGLLNNQIQVLDTKFDALVGYTTKLETTYTDLYNQFPHKHRSVKCLFLWRCGDRKITTPSPKDLIQSKPL